MSLTQMMFCSSVVNAELTEFEFMQAIEKVKTEFSADVERETNAKLNIAYDLKTKSIAAKNMGSTIFLGVDLLDAPILIVILSQ